MSSGFGYCKHCGFVLVHKGRCVKCDGEAVILIDEMELPESIRNSEEARRIYRLAEWKRMLRVTP